MGAGRVDVGPGLARNPVLFATLQQRVTILRVIHTVLTLALHEDARVLVFADH